MTDFTEHIELLKNIFKQHANIQTKIWQEKMMHNKFEFYGILTSLRKPLIKDYLNQWNKTYNKEEKKALFATMFSQRIREFKYSAIEFFQKWWKNTLYFNDLDWLLEILRHDIWWETVDSLDHVFGFILLHHPNKIEVQQYYDKLINDKNDWVKRIAIQSQLMLQKQTDFDLIFHLVKPLLNTENFYLIRSIGWSLRNAKRVEQFKVEQFIEENNINKKIISVINEH